MPSYPVKNLKTGETKELSMSMAKYDQWRKDNPDWDKDWMAGTGGVTYGTPKMRTDLRKSCLRFKQHILEQT